MLTSRLLAAALLDRRVPSGRSPVAYPDLVTNPGHLRKALHPSRAVVVMRGTELGDGRKASRGRWGRRAACKQVALKGLEGGAVVVGPPEGTVLGDPDSMGGNRAAAVVLNSMQLTSDKKILTN